MGKFIRAFAVFTFVLVTATTISFAVPQLINYQGTLNDGSGNPVNSTVNITFTIYNSPVGGDVLWTESQSVTVTDGVFNVVLGSQSPLIANTFDGNERYLGVKVGADPEMAPRQALVSVPFAYRAACIPGDFLNCYSDDPSTLNVGDCVAGTRTCQTDGAWGDCVGETTPVTEVCDGIDNNCDGQVDEGCGPPDGTLCDDDNECTIDDEYNGGVCAGVPAVGTSCTDFSPGDCAIAQCDDTGQCVQDYAFEPPTTECHPSAGPCDVAEYCTGSSAACPSDNFASPGTECHPSAGLCDIAEFCTGSSAACPSDNFASPGTECRAALPGGCDIAEYCTGSSAACPSDNFASPGTECRAAVPGGCDIAEFCTGSSATCPVDNFEPPSVECRASAGICDVEEFCTGSSAYCPSDGYALDTTECRPSAGPCDVAELCTYISPECPIDTYAPEGTECRVSIGECDPAEFCDGTNTACPADIFEPIGTSCGTDLICDGTGSCIPL